MVAVVSGNGLGLLNGSLGVLGGQGSVGSSSQGRLGEAVFVNAATGNLIISHQDDAIISGRGTNGLTRTYNSLGGWDGDNNDSWRIGVYRRLTSLSGTLNTSGSTIQKTEADGSVTTFTYDTSRSAYVSKDGSGAYNTLSYNGTNWTYRDGDSQASETYDWISGTGKLLSETDLDSNTTTYNYTGSLITSISTQNVKGSITEAIALNYTGNLLDNITYNGADDAGVAKSSRRVSYAYDASNRLKRVTVDLSPDDLSIADNKVYSTNYTYDANGCLSTMTQSDGTSLTFTYDGNGRVATVKDALNRTTSYDYSVAGQLTINDALNQATVITYETAAGNSNSYIKTIKDPAGNTVTYTYTSNGDIASVNDGRNTLTYSYDSNGNLLQQWDATGNTVSYTYDSANRKLTETHYRWTDSDGPGALLADGEFTTRYVYDEIGHLRFTISPEGRVSENIYGNVAGRNGVLLSTITYTEAFYQGGYNSQTGVPSEKQMLTWRNGQYSSYDDSYYGGIDKSKAQRTDYSYDFRGQVDTVTRYSSLNADGTGDLNTASSTDYNYDARGQLVSVIDPNTHGTSYAYDGMGRLIGTTNALTQTTQSTYDDAGRKVSTVYANGRQVISVYDEAGQLTSVMESNAVLSDLGTTRYYYDALGRERLNVDPTGIRHFTLYDAAGRKVGDLDHSGSLTEYRYTANGSLAQTYHYATPVAASFLTLGGANSLLKTNGTPSTLLTGNLVLASIKPTLNSADRTTWTLYDEAGRVSKTVDELGYVSELQYDGASRVIKTIRYNNPYAPLNTLTLNTRAEEIVVAHDAENDRVTRTFYDEDGLKLGDLDAEGYLTEYHYNAAGQLVSQTRKANQQNIPEITNSARFLQKQDSYNANFGGGEKDQLYITAQGDLFALLFPDYSSSVGGWRYLGKLGNGDMSRYRVADINHNGGLDVLFIGEDGDAQALFAGSNGNTSMSLGKIGNGEVARYQLFAKDWWMGLSYLDETGNIFVSDAAVAAFYGFEASFTLAGQFGSGEIARYQVNSSEYPVFVHYSYVAADGSISQCHINSSSMVDSYNPDRPSLVISDCVQIGSGDPTRYKLSEYILFYIAPNGEIIYSQAQYNDQTGAYEFETPYLFSQIGNGDPKRYFNASNGLGFTYIDEKGIAYRAAPRSNSLFYDFYPSYGYGDGNIDHYVNETYRGFNYFNPQIGSASPIDILDGTYYHIGSGLVFGNGDKTRYQNVDGLGKIFIAADGTQTIISQINTTSDNLAGFTTRTLHQFGNGEASRYRYLLGEANPDTGQNTYNASYIDVDGSIYEYLNVGSEQNPPVKLTQMGNGDAARYELDSESIIYVDTDGSVLRSSKTEGGFSVPTVVATIGNGEVSRYRFDDIDYNGLVDLVYVDTNGDIYIAYQKPLDGINSANGTVFDSPLNIGSLGDGEASRYQITTAYRSGYFSPNKNITYTSEYGDLSLIKITSEYNGLSDPIVTYGPTQAAGNFGNGDISRIFNYNSQYLIVRQTGEVVFYSITDQTLSSGKSLGYVGNGDISKYYLNSSNNYGGVWALIYVDELGREQAFSVIPEDSGQSSSPGVWLYSGMYEHVYDNFVNAVGVGDGYAIANGYSNSRVYNYAFDYYSHSVIAHSYSAANAHLAAATSSADDLHSYRYYDAQGRLTGEVDAEGYLTTYTYDDAGNRLSQNRYKTPVQGANEASSLEDLKATAGGVIRTRFSYDNLNRLSAEIAVDGTVTKYLYNTAGLLKSKTVAYGAVEAESTARTTSYTYDLDGQLLTTTDAKRTGVTKQVYDKANRLRYSEDAMEHRTLYYYDTTFSLNGSRYTYVVDAEGYVTRTGYNALGQVTSTRQSANRISNTNYLDTVRNGLGGLTNASLRTALNSAFDESLQSLDQRSSTTYTLNGLVQAVKDAFENETINEYSGFGQIVKQTNAKNSVTTFAYDRRGLNTLVIQDQGGDGNLNLGTSTSYDAFGRAIEVTDARGNTRHNYYDGLGRVIEINDPLSFSQKYTYDTLGRVLTHTDALNQRTITTYNDALRTVTVKTPEGVITETTLTRHGQTLSIRDGLGNTTRYSYDENGNLLRTLMADQQTHTDNEYDLNNRLIASYAASSNAELGTKTTYRYDLINRILTRVQDEVVTEGDGRLNLTTRYEYNGRNVTQTDANGIVTTTGFDAKGRNTVITVGGVTTRIEYDELDRKVKVIEGAGGDLSRATVYSYDAVGRRVSETILGARNEAGDAAVDLQTVYQYDANGNVVFKQDANQQSTRYVYDDNNRLIYTVDSLGAVTNTAYDRNGRVIKTRRFANTVLGLSEITTASEITAKLVFSSTRDQISYVAYNKDGKVSAELNAARQLTRTEYDIAGRVVSTTRFATPLAAGLTLTAQTTVAADPADQTQRLIYNALGQVAYTINPENYVTRQEFNATGQVIAEWHYANKFTIAGNPTESQMVDFATSAAATARVNRYAYDAAGRVQFAIDAGQYVTETRYYAGRNQIESTIRYAAKTETTDYQAAAIALDMEGRVDALNDQHTGFEYDAAGRLTGKTNDITSAETYSYNALGLKKTYTNAQGSTWEYQYDAAGRLLQEKTPAIEVSWTDAQGNLRKTITQMLTSYRYDGVGNVRFRSEGVSGSDTLSVADNLAFIKSQARTTEYRYDGVGHQVEVVGPTVLLDSGAIAITNALYQNETLDRSSSSNGVNWDNETTPITTVTYDALGRAVMQKDAGGKFSYKLYDALDRVKYEIDALKQVTEYSYDAFGNVISLTRYGAAISLTDGVIPSEAAVTSKLSLITDKRVIKTDYDHLNRVIAVREGTGNAYSVDGIVSSNNGIDTTGNLTGAWGGTDGVGKEWSKKTTTDYNAFGEAQKQATVLVGGSREAATYSYFDARGKKIAQVDAEGYLTRYSYDAFGNLLSTVEYAQSLGATWTLQADGTPVNPGAADVVSGNNRIQSSTYDQLNRKVTDSRVNVNYDELVGLNAVKTNTGTLTTRYGYDAVGNQTRLEDAQGNVTQTYYDALGRQRAVLGAERTDSSTSLQLPSLEVWHMQAKTSLVTSVPPASYVAAYVNKVVLDWAATPLSGWGNGEVKISLTYLKKTRVFDGIVQGSGYSMPNYRDVVQTSSATFEKSFNSKTIQNGATLEWSSEDGIVSLSTVTISVYSDGAYHEIYQAAPNTYKKILRIENPGANGSKIELSVDGNPIADLTPADKPFRYFVGDVSAYTGDHAYTMVWKQDGAAILSSAAGNHINFSSLGAKSTPVAESNATVSGKSRALTTMEVDVYGNVLRSTVYANNAKSYRDALESYAKEGIALDGLANPDADRTTTSRYDLGGHLLMQTDAEGNVIQKAYDWAGHVTREWVANKTAEGVINNLVREFKYDAVGRQVATYTKDTAPSQSSLLGSPEVISSSMSYQASARMMQTGQSSYVYVPSVNLHFNSLASWGFDSIKATVYYSKNGVSAAPVSVDIDPLLDLSEKTVDLGLGSSNPNVMQDFEITNVVFSGIGEFGTQTIWDASLQASAPGNRYTTSVRETVIGYGGQGAIYNRQAVLDLDLSQFNNTGVTALKASVYYSINGSYAYAYLNIDPLTAAAGVTANIGGSVYNNPLDFEVSEVKLEAVGSFGTRIEYLHSELDQARVIAPKTYLTWRKPAVAGMSPPVTRIDDVTKVTEVMGEMYRIDITGLTGVDLDFDTTYTLATGVTAYASGSLNTSTNELTYTETQSNPVLLKPNRVIQERSVYNAYGEIIQSAQGEDFAALGSQVYKTATYDELGRVWSITDQYVQTVNFYNSLGMVLVSTVSPSKDLRHLTGTTFKEQINTLVSDAGILTPTELKTGYQRTTSWVDRLGRIVRQQQPVYQAKTATTFSGALGQKIPAEVSGTATSSYNSIDLGLNWDSVQDWGGTEIKLEVDYTVNYYGPLQKHKTIEQLDTSVTGYNWSDALGYTPNSTGNAVDRVQVFVKVNNVWVKARDSSNKAANSMQSWVRSPATTPGRAVIRYRPVTGGNWSLLTVDVRADGLLFVADITARANMPAGKYTYQFFYYDEGVSPPLDANDAAIVARASSSTSGVFSVGSSTATTSVGLPNVLITPVVKQGYDRWGNVTRNTDAAGVQVENRYNANNQLTATIAKGISITDAAGQDLITNIRNEYFYDALGRKIGTRDAESVRQDRRETIFSGQVVSAGTVDSYVNSSGTSGLVTTATALFTGNSSGGVYTRLDVTTTARALQTRTRYDELGHVISEENAAGGLTRQAYDNFGNRTLLTQGYGSDARVTQFDYDRNGRLRKQRQPKTTETYRNDALGNRIETSQWLSADGKERIVTRQAYDAFGRVIRTGVFDYENYQEADTRAGLRNFQSVSDLIKAKTGNGSTANPGLSTYVNGSGLESTVQYDAFGNKVRETNTAGDTLTWTYYGKRLYSHTDLAGVTTNYGYNSAGGLVSQGTNRSTKVTGGIDQKLRYAYDEAGNLKSIVDQSVGANNATQSFITDVQGRQVQDNFVDANGIRYNTIREYDALGRLSRVSSEDGSSVSYRYDANGNRRKVQARWREGTESSPVTYNSSGQVVQQNQDVNLYKRKDYWYDYDKADRMLVSQGILNDGHIEASAAGLTWKSTYVGSSSAGGSYSYQVFSDSLNQGIEMSYNALGERVETMTVKSDSKAQYDYFTYDDNGRLQEIMRWDDGDIDRRNNGDTSSLRRMLSSRRYDGANRLVVQNNWDLSNVTVSAKETRTNTYDGAGRLVLQAMNRWQGETAIESGATAYQLDAAGNVRTQTTFHLADGGSNNQTYTINYRYDYTLMDSFKEERTVGTGNLSGYTPGETRQTYDANGNLKSTIFTGDNNRNRNFVSNLTGQILSKNNTKTGNNLKTQRYLTEGNGMRLSYGTLEAMDADQNYTPVSDSSVAATPGKYIVNDGDTLKSIAMATWGDSSLWYVIAEANGLESDNQLRVGQSINIPSRANQNHNSASTVKPYNPGAIVGDTTPSLTPPPPPQNCGVAGQILMVVVAVVVAYFTAGALLEALGPVLSGAIGGAAGSVASQGVGMATGHVQEFSWKQVGMAAIAGGIAAGVTNGFSSEGLNANGLTTFGQKGGMAKVLFGASGKTAAVLNATMSNAMTQGVNILTGNQKRFDWLSVAATAASSSININLPEAKFGNVFTNTLTNSFASGVISSSIRLALYGKGKMDWANVAADAFGNALAKGIQVANSNQPANGVEPAYSYTEDEINPNAANTGAGESNGTVPLTYPTDQSLVDTFPVYADAAKWVNTTMTDSNFNGYTVDEKGFFVTLDQYGPLLNASENGTGYIITGSKSIRNLVDYFDLPEETHMWGQVQIITPAGVQQFAEAMALRTAASGGEIPKALFFMGSNRNASLENLHSELGNYVTQEQATALGDVISNSRRGDIIDVSPAWITAVKQSELVAYPRKSVADDIRKGINLPITPGGANPLYSGFVGIGNEMRADFETALDANAPKSIRSSANRRLAIQGALSLIGMPWGTGLRAFSGLVRQSSRLISPALQSGSEALGTLGRIRFVVTDIGSQGGPIRGLQRGTSGFGLKLIPKPLSPELLDAAKRLGVNLDDIVIHNGVAKLKIGQADLLNPNDINQLKKILQARGATKGEIDSGFIANEKLDQFLRRRVQDGKPFAGGTVRLSESKGSDFTIFYDFE